MLLLLQPGKRGDTAKKRFVANRIKAAVVDPAAVLVYQVNNVTAGEFAAREISQLKYGKMSVHEPKFLTSDACFATKLS
jgi:hypothetical protein